MSAPSRPAEILLIEDNPGDVELIHEALQFGKVLNRISVATDGEAAMAFLNRAAGFEDAPRPDLILLDLNLPGKSGHEVLVEIKGDSGLRRIPVMVLTSSGDVEDLQRVYGLHANCYVRKPADLGEFVELVRSIEQFWFRVVTLPSR